MKFEDVPQLEMFYRIYNWLVNGEKQPPFKLILTPTDRCNLNCFFCPNSIARKSGQFRESDELSEKEWLKIVDDAIRIGVHDFIVLGGGEPFVRKDLVMKIFRHVKGRYNRAYFEVITNGTLLNNDDIIEIVDKEMSTLTLSIHGITKKTYQQIMGNNKVFKKVVSNLEKIKEAKKNLNKFVPSVQINVVVNSLNYGDIPQMIEFFGKLGCEYLAFHYMRCYEDIQPIAKNFELAQDQLEKLKVWIQELSKTSEEKGIIIRSQTLENKIPVCSEERLWFLRLRCYEPWYGISIHPDGRVSRCTAFFTRKETASIREDTLENIWYGKFFEEVRENVIKGIMMKGCSQCGLISSTNYIKSLAPLFLNFLKGNISIAQIKNILRIK
jgi:radical SAM protein with 4Fe4S-binding SPASM domain